jgi:hypothetical protein
MGPPADLGVEWADHGCLGPGPTAANDPPELRQMRFDIGLGGFDQRFEPEPLVAPGIFPGVVGSHPILTDMKPQNIHAGLIPFQGVVDASFGDVQRQSDGRQPRDEEVLAVFSDRALLVEDHAVIRLGDDTGLRIDLGDGHVHPMQGDQRQQR